LRTTGLFEDWCRELRVDGRRARSGVGVVGSTLCGVPWAYKMCLPPIWRAVVLALHKLFNVKLNASLSAIPASGVACVQPQLAQKAICDLRADRGESRHDQASYGPLVGMMGARTTGGGGSVRCAQERALAAKDVAGSSGTFHLMPGLSRLREFRQEHAGSILGSYPFVCGPFHPELFVTLSHTITHSVNQATALSSSRLYPSCSVLTLSQQWRRLREHKKVSGDLPVGLRAHR
jgi:hypothetical protein